MAAVRPLSPTQVRAVARAFGVTDSEVRRRMADSAHAGQWVGVGEAATECGCSATFVRETLILGGHVNARRNGRRWVVCRDSLKQYIRSRQTLPSAVRAVA